MSIFSGVGEAIGRLQNTLSSKKERELAERSLMLQGFQQAGALANSALDRQNVIKQKTMDEEAAAIQKYMDQLYTYQQAVEQVRLDEETDVSGFNAGHQEHVTGVAQDMSKADTLGSMEAEYTDMGEGETYAGAKLADSLEYFRAQTDAQKKLQNLQQIHESYLQRENLSAEEREQLRSIEAQMDQLETSIAAEQQMQKTKQGFEAKQSVLNRGFTAKESALDRGLTENLTLQDLEQQNSQFLSQMELEEKKFYDSLEQETKMQVLRGEQTLDQIRSQGVEARSTDAAATENAMTLEQFKTDLAMDILSKNPDVQAAYNIARFYPTDAQGNSVDEKRAETLMANFDKAREEMFNLAQFGEFYTEDPMMPGVTTFNAAAASEYLAANGYDVEGMDVREIKVLLNQALYEATLTEFAGISDFISPNEATAEDMINLYELFYADSENLLGDYEQRINADVSGRSAANAEAFEYDGRYTGDTPYIEQVMGDENVVPEGYPQGWETPEDHNSEIASAITSWQNMSGKLFDQLRGDPQFEGDPEGYMTAVMDQDYQAIDTGLRNSEILNMLQTGKAQEISKKDLDEFMHAMNGIKQGLNAVKGY